MSSLEVLRLPSIHHRGMLHFIARAPGAVPNIRGVLVIGAGPGGNFPLAIHISLATRLQTSSTFCRVVQYIHILTEPPCEALVLGPSLLNPVLLGFLSHCFSESPEQSLTGPKQSQRHTKSCSIPFVFRNFDISRRTECFRLQRAERRTDGVP